MRRGLVISGAIAVVAASAILASRPFGTFPDESIVAEMRQPGNPLDIYTDERLVQALREIGASYGSIYIRPMRDLFFAMLESPEAAAFEHVRSEAERGARLLEAATGLGEDRSAIEAAAAADPSRRRLLRQADSSRIACRDRVLRLRDASPEIERQLLSSIETLEEAGYGALACPSIEALADYYELAGNLERAYECWNRALECRGPAGHPSSLANDERHIAALDYENADYGEAERRALSSLRFARRSEDPDALSRSLDMLSMTRAKQGSFFDAESLMHEAQRIATPIYEPALDLARVTELASLYTGIGEYGLAQTHIREALRIGGQIRSNPRFRSYYNYEAVVGYNLSLCRTNEAAIRLAEGNRPEAFDAMRAALAEAERSGDKAQQIEVSRRLGEVYAALGSGAKARRAIERSISLARSRDRRDLEAAALVSLGELSLESGDARAAAARFSEAVASARSGDHRVEEIAAMHALAGAKRKLGERDAAVGLLRGAIGVFRREAARRRFIGDRHALSERIDAVLADLVEIECERSCPADSLLLLAEEARRLRAGRGGPGAEVSAGAESLLRDTSWIPENAIVVQHLVTRDHLVIALLDRSGASYRVLPVSRDSLERECSAFIRAAAAPPGGTPSRRELAALSRSLYRLLIEPVAERIEGRELLCFIPDRTIQRLPFAALAPEAGSFLVESHPIMSSPDLVTLARGCAAPNRSAEGRFASSLLVGRPDPSPCVDRRYPYLRLLPHAQTELLEVLRLVDRGRVLAGADATKEAILAAMTGAEHIHIATHHVVYPPESGGSALLVSPPGGCDADDPIEESLITEEDVRRTGCPRAALVFLSACESAGGPRDPGLGMAGAFLDAGARAVLAAAWPIDDREAAAFSGEFYRELRLGGGDPSKALQRVQVRLIDRERRGDGPDRAFSWAPYLLLGNPGTAPEHH